MMQLQIVYLFTLLLKSVEFNIRQNLEEQCFLNFISKFKFIVNFFGLNVGDSPILISGLFYLSLSKNNQILIKLIIDSCFLLIFLSQKVSVLHIFFMFLALTCCNKHIQFQESAWSLWSVGVILSFMLYKTSNAEENRATIFTYVLISFFLVFVSLSMNFQVELSSEFLQTDLAFEVPDRLVSS